MFHFNLFKISPESTSSIADNSSQRTEVFLRMLKDAESLLLRDKLSPEDLERVMARLEDMKGKLRAQVVDAVEAAHSPEVEDEVSPEEAAEVMGKRNYFGPEAVKKTFGVELPVVPQIPFSRAELVRAKELNQMLILRVDKTADGKPLVMKAMNKYSKRGKKVFNDSSWNRCKNEGFFTSDTPNISWALVTRDILPGSARKTNLQEAECLARYVSEVFEGQKMPREFAEAIAELEAQKDEISSMMWIDRQKKLSQLKLNKLFRRSPVEIVYDSIIVLKTANVRLLEGVYETTPTLSSHGDLVNVGRAAGRFSDGGLSVNSPSGSIRSGIYYSRSR